VEHYSAAFLCGLLCHAFCVHGGGGEALLRSPAADGGGLAAVSPDNATRDGRNAER